MRGRFQKHGMAARPEAVRRFSNLLGHVPRRYQDFVAKTARSPLTLFRNPVILQPMFRVRNHSESQESSSCFLNKRFESRQILFVKRAYSTENLHLRHDPVSLFQTTAP